MLSETTGMKIVALRYHRRSMQRRAHDPFLVSVCALGLTQITAWGTSYYCLGILASPIAAETGWSSGFVYSGFTVALLVMGAISAWAGRAVDRWGARKLMSIGTVLLSAGLVALSFANSYAAYLLAWAFLGAAMRFCLYDAAFAGLVQVVPSRGRTAISYLTLFGAFASTVFWVLGHYLNEASGWRGTLQAFAAINLAVCLPLNWYGLARRERHDADDSASAAAQARDGPPLTGRTRTIAMALFGVVMSLNGLVFGVVSVQMVQLLEAAGLAVAAAVWIASLKGFAQFGGRIVEIFFGRRLHAMTVARIAVGALPVSFVVLLASGGSFAAILAFTLLMGASQGVITIVRGAVPLALFGREGYGLVLGVLATPVIVVNAASPMLFAMVVDAGGWRVALWVLLGCATGSWIAMEVMARWYERQQRAAPGPHD